MRFWQMIGLDSSLGPELTGSYNVTLLILSVLIASLAAYAALGVVERMASSNRKKARLTWHLIGATAMGCGVWAMHFTGMLAFSLPITVSYDPLLTAISVAPAIIGSACAIYVMAKSSINFWHLQCGALLLAVGIGLMHYTGMDAMRMEAAMRYDTTLFILSIVIAHILAMTALYIRFKIVNTKGNYTFITLLGAFAMGCSVSGMHYTAMAAARYYDSGSHHSLTEPGLSPTVLATTILLMATLFLGLTIIGALIDRRLEEMNKSLKDSERRRQLILETMVDGLITVDSSGCIESVNPAAEVMLGYAPGTLIGKQHSVVYHTKSDSKPYPEEENPIYDTFTHGEPHHIESDMFWRRDGSCFPVEYISTPMYEEKQLVGAVITFRDITQRKDAEREQKELHQQLVDVSRQAGQAEIATGVLHNVGNVLNSVNVSATLVANKIRQSKSANLTKVSQLMHDHANDLGTFMTEHEKGTQLPVYLNTLAEHLESERQTILDEFQSINENIAHIKQIVSRQQSFAGSASAIQPLDVSELLNDAWLMSVSEHHDIDIVRAYADIPEVTMDKHKILQIVINLLRNAKQSFNDYRKHDKQIILSTKQVEENRIQISVTDNGIGIAEENSARVFEYGFTTKDEGHGFGLHASANAAKEMGGSLTCKSAGIGKGATFILELPIIAAKEQAA